MLIALKSKSIDIDSLSSNDIDNYPKTYFDIDGLHTINIDNPIINIIDIDKVVLNDKITFRRNDIDRLNSIDIYRHRYLSIDYLARLLHPKPVISPASPLSAKTRGCGLSLLPSASPTPTNYSEVVLK